jgi:4-amino-4-deoxychorismate lyase
MVLINGLLDDKITITDRGLHYGDGLFETMLYRAQTIEFLEAHLARLIDGARRLNIEFVQQKQLRDELTRICQHLAEDDAIIKVIITRGSGGRGYLAMSGIEPSRIISTHALPDYPSANSNTGVKLRFCNHTLSENAKLAGIKHLNRLDQVIARSEWHDPSIAEGLMLDSSGNVIEGTMSNIFTVKSGQILTPKLDKSGVAGVMRGQIIQFSLGLNIPVLETSINVDDLMSSEEVFICNSIIGIWPVLNIGNMTYSIGHTTQCLQSVLDRLRK